MGILAYWKDNFGIMEVFPPPHLPLAYFIWVLIVLARYGFTNILLVLP